jgi:hypothetical protein
VAWAAWAIWACEPTARCATEKPRREAGLFFLGTFLFSFFDNFQPVQ